MFQALAEPVTFEEFLEWKPENSRYELHKGVIVEMQPTGEHELVRAFLIRELNFEIRRLNIKYVCKNIYVIANEVKQSQTHAIASFRFAPFAMTLYI